MNRKFLFGLLVLPLSLVSFPMFVSAQALTVSDVRQVAPQLSVVLNQLGKVIAVRQTAFNRQNIALAGMAGTIGVIGNDVSDINNQSLSVADSEQFGDQVNTLNTVFGQLGTYINRIAQDRTNFNAALGTVTSIIGSISSTIATASV